MAVEHGKSGRDDEPSDVRVAALVRDAQRALAEAEQLLADVQQASTTLSASDLAARQAAIVDAAHEEAAVILAKAHADAARILEQALGRLQVGASGGGPAPETSLGARTEAVEAVVDLRSDPSTRTTADPDPLMGPADTEPPTMRSPMTSPVVHEPVHEPVVHGPVDAVDAEVRASIAAAADMARRVSGRIERLSQDLHQAPAS